MVFLERGFVDLQRGGWIQRAMVRLISGQHLYDELVPATAAKLEEVLGYSKEEVRTLIRQLRYDTRDVKPEVPLRFMVYLLADRKYDYRYWCEETYFLKKLAGIKKGAVRGGHEVVGYVTLKEVYEIGRHLATRNVNFQDNDLEHVCRFVANRAKSMGIRIVPDAELERHQAQRREPPRQSPGPGYPKR